MISQLLLGDFSTVINCAKKLTLPSPWRVTTGAVRCRSTHKSLFLGTLFLEQSSSTSKLWVLILLEITWSTINAGSDFCSEPNSPLFQLSRVKSSCFAYFSNPVPKLIKSVAMKKMTRLLKFFWLYRCTSSQESCGGLIFDGNGIIRSPPSLTNANVYADNLDCRWLLGTGEARRSNS